MTAMKITELDTEDEAREQGYDHVRVAVDGIVRGYRGFGKTTIALQRCPVCLSENYVLAISSGACHACGFDVNEEQR